MSTQMDLFGKPAKNVPDESFWKRMEKRRQKAEIQEAQLGRREAKLARSHSTASSSLGGTASEHEGSSVQQPNATQDVVHAAGHFEHGHETATLLESQQGQGEQGQETGTLLESQQGQGEQGQETATLLESQQGQGQQGQETAIAKFPRMGVAAGRPMCARCHVPVDPCRSGVRRLKKSPPMYSCSLCNAKGVSNARSRRPDRNTISG